MRTRHADAGFTLIELLVVVIVIGLLAAIAIPTFLAQRENAWRAQAVSDMKHSVLAVESYVAGANDRDYTDVDGWTQATPELRDWGMATTPWTQLTVSADTGRNFCVVGHHELIADQDLKFSKADGVVRLGPVGSLTCP